MKVKLISRFFILLIWLSVYPTSTFASGSDPLYFNLQIGQTVDLSMPGSDNFYYEIPSSDLISISHRIIETTEGELLAIVSITGNGVGSQTVTFHQSNTEQTAYAITVNAKDISTVILAPCYQFFSRHYLTYLYTASEEAKDLIILHPEWTYVYEGIVFYVYIPKEEDEQARELRIDSLEMLQQKLKQPF